jgi:hypothetical protein
MSVATFLIYKLINKKLGDIIKIYLIIIGFFLTSFSVNARKGKLTTFVSPDGELVVEVHGRAAKQLKGFLQRYQEPISENMLRASFRASTRAGLRAGIRAGSVRARTQKAVPAGVREGVRAGIREQSADIGVRVGIRSVEKRMLRARANSLRVGTRAGIRQAMAAIMSIRANRSVVYRFVFKGVNAKPSYPHTGKAVVQTHGRKSLSIMFEGGTSEALRSIGELKESNIKIDCVTQNSCNLNFEL